MSNVHKLYKAFDAYPTLETCGVFLDMFKAFDKVWHKGLIFKLKSVGVSDSLLHFIESFLKFVSAIFYQIFIFHQMTALHKTMKIVFYYI